MLCRLCADDTDRRIFFQIEDVRQQTKMEKKRLAMAMREKQLDQLGMMVGFKTMMMMKMMMIGVMMTTLT